MLTLCMAFLITGNIMDNAKGTEKRVITYLEFALAFTFEMWALAFRVILPNESS